MKPIDNKIRSKDDQINPVDNQLRELFQDYHPHLEADNLFMASLDSKLKKMESVKLANERYQRSCKIAMGLAAVSGIIIGLILSLFVPMVGNLMENITISLPMIEHTFSLDIDIRQILWWVIGAASVLVAVNIYDIILSRMRTEQ